jgi:hypothetical protein
MMAGRSPASCSNRSGTEAYADCRAKLRCGENGTREHDASAAVNSKVGCCEIRAPAGISSTICQLFSGSPRDSENACMISKRGLDALTSSTDCRVAPPGADKPKEGNVDFVYQLTYDSA